MKRVLPLLVIVLAAVLVALWQLRTPVAPSAETGRASVTPPKSGLDAQTTGTADKGSTGGSAKCLNPSQLATHLPLAAEAERLDEVGVTGPTIAAYRNLSASELAAFAAQGDSAAMAVLGAMAVMRARDLSETRAVPFLLGEDPKLAMAAIVPRSSTPEAREQFEIAIDWFYRSALHGRLLALNYVGMSYSAMQRGPVELGWIEHDRYRRLSATEHNSLQPGFVYLQLAYDLAPELREGPLGNAFDILPRTKRHLAVAERLAEQFERNRIDAGLPPIAVAHSAAPSFQELTGIVCEEYLARPPDRDDHPD